MSKKKRYDYMAHIDAYHPDGKRCAERLLRKLVRDAVMEFADQTSCAWTSRPNNKELASRIANELVPSSKDKPPQGWES